MDNDELLRKYLEGDLGPEEDRKALHTIADDPEMRAMLRFEQKLSDRLNNETLTFNPDLVPEGFSDRVMNKIEQPAESFDEVSLWSKIKNSYQQLWTPTTIQWRPAYGFVVGLLVLGSLLYPLLLNYNKGHGQLAQNITDANIGDSVQQVSTGVNKVLLRFVYLDKNAKSVAVAGDFSNWKMVKLSKQTVNGQQVWTGLVSMSRGEHNYMFVKNGTKWVTDPLAPVQRDDGFGNKNAVIYL